ncbi:hypothetical protein [Mariniluteicoccus flavus]
MVTTRAPMYAALAVMVAAAGCTSTPGAPVPSGPAATAPQAPRSELPAPDAPTAAPSGAVTSDDLPRASDLGTLGGVTWAEGETTAASPRTPISACQRSKWESTGATALQVRTFTGPGGATAGAVVLSYPDAATAEQAITTLTTWAQSCGEVISSNGGTDAMTPLAPTPVRVDGAQAQVSETAWKSDRGPRTESQGLVRRGDRVAFVAYGSGARTDDGDVAEHPMTRTLPLVAQRLAP